MRDVGDPVLLVLIRTFEQGFRTGAAIDRTDDRGLDVALTLALDDFLLELRDSINGTLTGGDGGTAEN